MGQDRIVLRGVEEHNLKGVDLSIPRDSLTVFTGISGSGKSSLAFDTLFQEGQRRFLESLSAYARQFLGQIQKPRLDHAEGLSPTISIDQRSAGRNPRSTVGTITEVFDHLRLLFARLGSPHCVKCGTEIASQTADQITHRVFTEGKGREVLILAPIVLDRKGEYRKELEELRREGFVRARVDGKILRLDGPIPLGRYEKHTIEAVMDRLLLRKADRSRLAEGIEKALRKGKGVVTVLQDGRPQTFSTLRACPDCGTSLPELEPRLFSFNTPQGGCPRCGGLGETKEFDPGRVVPDPTLSILDGAIAPQRRHGRILYSQIGTPQLRQMADRYGFSLSTPWKDLPRGVRSYLLRGPGHEPRGQGVAEGRPLFRGRRGGFRGIIGHLEHGYSFTRPRHLERYMAIQTCRGCGGTRLRRESLAVRFRGESIGDLAARSVSDLLGFFQDLTLSERESKIGREIIKEVQQRLTFLVRVGLGYLTLNRSAATLAGGEAQRIRLARQVGSRLQGVLYCLDEPSIGLHPRDNRRLLRTLRDLRDLGNTVVVVEHDLETMEAADHLVDIGPGAGSRGGEIVAAGGLDRILRSRRSVTGLFLRGEDRIPIPERRRSSKGEVLRILGARQHNLKGITVEIPLGCFVAVTGVSGSGKSTLVDLVLRRALARRLHGAEATPGAHDRIEGADRIDKVIEIDQDPIGRTPRSNPATYTKVFTEIRDLFANLPESRLRGYPKGRFSFNVKGGRCEECRGAGVLEIEMQFLSNVEIPCDTCDGKRFNRETLEVTYKGKSIADVLDLSVEDALEFFRPIPKIARTLETLAEVGLGYISLGQPSTTLSGGEAQRVKLASEMRRPGTGRTLYLLDEPTTGLHFADIKRLLVALSRLVDEGNTVVVIEHNLDVIKVADFIIDLGPEGGEAGGYVVASGTPEEVMKDRASETGRALKAFLRSTPAHKGSSPGGRRRPRDLHLKGGTIHNLKNIDVRIPKDKLTVITGVSGSGKTSLALDTIFAEGQRRFVESMSTYARRFLGRLDRAPVQSIEGLSPAIAIDQRNASRNPRSTVATNTEIYDYLRLLFARIGRPHCPDCEGELRSWSPTSLADHLIHEAPGSDALLLAPLHLPDWPRPLALKRPSALEKVRGSLVREGYLRAVVQGKVIRLDGKEKVAPGRAEDPRIYLVIDRVTLRPKNRSRVAEGLEAAFDRGRGLVAVRLAGSEPDPYSREPACVDCGTIQEEELQPRQFSFNSHHGACEECTGLGEVRALDVRLLIANPELPLFDGALAERPGYLLSKRGGYYRSVMTSVAESHGFDISIPYKELPARAKKILLNGVRGKVKVHLRRRRKRGRRYKFQSRWVGLRSLIRGWYSQSDGGWWTERVEKVMSVQTCPSCDGGRLRAASLAVQVGGKGIAQVCGMTVEEAARFFSSLDLTSREGMIGKQVLKEIRSRLSFLIDVGLNYLALDRGGATLSGGEAQRIRLASQLGSRLAGVLYVLDEPTVGLHQKDNRKLLDTLQELKELGNTVLVVEHDEQTIREADHVLDLGPGAGARGGSVVASGPPSRLERGRSLTGRYLRGTLKIPIPKERRGGNGKALWVRGARQHNLKGIDVRIPLGTFTALTGVSGSGKSTLLLDCLLPALRAETAGEQPDEPPRVRRVEGAQEISKVLVIDQTPIGRSPKSNPATYAKVLGPIRDVFAQTRPARMKGFAKARFSFNHWSGQCPACEGKGSLRIEMHFLSDVWIRCDVCKGKRYNEETLNILYRGRSVADVLEMEVSEASQFFENHPRIVRTLRTLEEVGLGYMPLGQAATTLSGGEAQRVKLASELSARTKGGALYLLDEPTTGLHFDDVKRLVQVLQRLVDEGGTVVVIEHNLDVIRSADHVIDLGPGGGEAGGAIVAQGTPEEIAACKESHTGKYLK